MREVPETHVRSTSILYQYPVQWTIYSAPLLSVYFPSSSQDLILYWRTTTELWSTTTQVKKPSKNRNTVWRPHMKNYPKCSCWCNCWPVKSGKGQKQRSAIERQNHLKGWKLFMYSILYFPCFIFNLSEQQAAEYH